MLGFVNLFKPAGPTSTQFGARLRRIYAPSDGAKLAVGHFGTLDPQAAGVLPIALGQATRLLPLIEDRRKAYAFTLVLGPRDDDRRRGRRDRRDGGRSRPTSTARLRGRGGAFIGHDRAGAADVLSAVHHGGQRLYELARARDSRRARQAQRDDLRA